MSNKQQQNTELKPVILASTSPSRRSILKSAGIVFTARSPDVDEDILKKKFTGSPKKLALMLAEKKALSLSSKYELALVIGADQVLSFKILLLEGDEEAKITRFNSAFCCCFLLIFSLFF